MPRRSLQEDALLVGALHLHMEAGSWGAADLPEALELISSSEVVEHHVVSRALRKFRNEDWVTAERDPDASMGPRYLYTLTEDQGIPTALEAAGRELAKGTLYPIPVLAAFGATALGQEMIGNSAAPIQATDL